MYEYAKNAENKKDMRAAVDLYEKACNAGDPRGCGVAGYWYADGHKGVPKDNAKAATLDKLACQGNVGGACFNLGLLYYGVKGVARDLDEAARAFDKACTLGEKDGCQNVKQLAWKTAIQASDLWRSYSANEVAADNKWKGQRLMVAGLLQSIDKDFTNDVVLGLRSSNQFMPTRAYLNDDEVKTAANLRKGQRLLLTCTCDGRVMGSPVLKGCAINDVANAPRDDDE